MKETVMGKKKQGYGAVAQIKFRAWAEAMAMVGPALGPFF